jgi:hypothetical protein
MAIVKLTAGMWIARHTYVRRQVERQELKEMGGLGEIYMHFLEDWTRLCMPELLVAALTGHAVLQSLSKYALGAFQSRL